MLTDVVTVLAQDPAVVLPPTSPVAPPPEAMTRFTQAVGWVKWGATAVVVAGVMAIGALLTIDLLKYLHNSNDLGDPLAATGSAWHPLGSHPRPAGGPGPAPEPLDELTVRGSRSTF